MGSLFSSGKALKGDRRMSNSNKSDDMMTMGLAFQASIDSIKAKEEKEKRRKSPQEQAALEADTSNSRAANAGVADTMPSGIGAVST